MTTTEDPGALWGQFCQTRSGEARDTLIRHYAWLARRTVDRLQISAWGCISREDLLSHAIVGLIDAIDRFDPQVGVPFEAYARPRIRGAVMDALRRLDWAPRSLRSNEARLRRAYARLEGALGRAPTDEEVARELEITLAELSRLETGVARGLVVSLEDLVAGAWEPGGSGEELIEDREADPYCHQERHEALKRLVTALQALPDREQQVVSLYYYRGLTLREIGKVLAISEQRVSQLHARAITRLSHKLGRHNELLHCLAA